MKEEVHTHVASKETKNRIATFVYAHAAVLASIATRWPCGILLRCALGVLDPGLEGPILMEYEFTERLILSDMLRNGFGRAGFGFNDGDLEACLEVGMVASSSGSGLAIASKELKGSSISSEGVRGF